MYRRILRARSRFDVKMPRAMTSRSIFANQSSTWLSHEGTSGEVQLHARMRVEKRLDLLRLMRSQIIEDEWTSRRAVACPRRR